MSSSPMQYVKTSADVRIAYKVTGTWGREHPRAQRCRECLLPVEPDISKQLYESPV